MASPVKRDAAAVTKEPEKITETELTEMKEELKKEMPEKDAEKAVEILRKLSSNNTNSEEALGGFVSLLLIAIQLA